MAPVLGIVVICTVKPRNPEGRVPGPARRAVIPPVCPRPGTWAILLALAACTPVAPPAPASPAATAQGVIVSLRPSPAPGGGDVRANILGAIGATGPAPHGTAATEFIIRQDDGQTISVVQPNTANLRPGDHVRLTHTPQTHIAPTPPGS